jgi:hypothetical protein
MNTNTTPAAGQPASARRADLVQLVVAAVAFAAVMAAVPPTLRVPPHVDRLTVENPHPWEITVAVTDDDRDGWHPIGALERESEQRFLQLVDQGDRWTFRFSYAGEQADLSVTAAQLEEDGWRVTVPDQLAADLRAAGVAETPP